ncbi:hypothetical protein KJ991_00650 [Patescibacteria group bacterium]|nr:hypothetical protein [Patescibacteria group bacterium]MBU4057733.1 hypothetical protein [Patescibacteria group bacterium]MBU4116092.1 hypothetical protein [Patescibacteria group bacterium]
MKKLILYFYPILFLIPSIVSADRGYMMNFDSVGCGGWGGMMGYGGLWSWFMVLIPVVWLIVGILVIIWLWGKINKK